MTTVHDACKQLLLRCIVNADCKIEAYHRLGIAVMDGNFDTEEAAAIAKLIDLRD